MNSFVVNMPNYDLSDDQLLALSEANDNIRIERNSKGQIIIMAPTGGFSGYRNSELNAEIGIWNRLKKTGKVFDSSTGFSLSNGAMYSPDVAWIPNAKWNKISDSDKEKFLPLCPDFLVELRSKTDRLKDLFEKMEEYMECGCRLAWLIDPYNEMVYIYRKGQSRTEQTFNEKLSGEDVLVDFELNLKELF